MNVSFLELYTYNYKSEVDVCGSTLRKVKIMIVTSNCNCVIVSAIFLV